MVRSLKNAGRLLVAGALTAASACTDLRPPTAPPAKRLSVASPANAKIKITKLQLNSNTLRIDGPAAIGMAQITASGLGSVSDVVTHVEIAQPAAVQSGKQPDAPLNCDGAPQGVLTDGICPLTFDFTVKNNDPAAGTLVPGPAILRLSVMQRSVDGFVLLATKEMTVNLVGTPKISSLTLAPSYLAINGTSVSYTATLQNPANGLQGVAVQVFIRQGESLRLPEGSSILVSCGGPAGQLPNGTCTLTLPTSAANPGGHSGPLAPGAATFLLVMSQNGSPLDSITKDITLIPQSPHILSVNLDATTFTIGGTGVGYSAQLTNGGATASDISIQSYIEQAGSGLDAKRAGGGAKVSCPNAAAGVLPTTTTASCTFSSSASASNTNGGTGTLVAGPAKFVVYLRQGTTDLESSSIDITLVAPPSGPTITLINLPAPNLVLGGLAQSGTVSIKNGGAPVANVLIQEWVSQPGTRHAAGGGQVSCPGGTPVLPGTLPTGTCMTPISATATNLGSGDGTLVPGPATLEVELKINDVVVDTKTIPVTILSPTPAILGIELPADPIPIFTSKVFTVTISNPTSATLTGDVSIQGWVEQASGTISWPTGGTSIQCGSAISGNLPPGICTFQSSINVTNPNQLPSLTPGLATFRLVLYNLDGTIDEKSVPVTLASPPSP